MEIILIITILLLLFIAYRESSHQKQILVICELFTTGKTKPENINPFKKIFKKDFEKNFKTETDRTEIEKEGDEDKYLPLEDVPEEEIRNSFEGTKKVDKEEVEI